MRTWTFTALLAIALSLVPTPLAAADDNGIVETTYAYAWLQTDDFLRCGWNIARTPFEAARQDTVYVDVAQALTDPTVRGAIANTRAVTDPLAAAADLATDEGVEQAIRDADSEGQATKCAISFYMIWAAYTFVWDNPGVNCYIEAFPTCATPVSICAVDTAVAYMLWPFEIYPLGTQDPISSRPDGPCLPPTQFNCVNNTPIGACIPPPGPGRFRCAHVDTVLSCVQEGI